MAEKNGVSSRANLLISIRYLWVTLPPPGHHAREMTFNLSLFYYKRKYEERKIKANDGLGKRALRIKVPHTLYKGTHE
jgi:hypothetical protein